MRQQRIFWVFLSVTLTLCALASTAASRENRLGPFQPSMGPPSPSTGLASSLGPVPLGSTAANPRFISKTLRFRPLAFFPSPFGLVGTPQTSITIVVVPPAVDQQEPPVASESASVKSQPLFIVQRCGEFVRVPPAEAMRGAEESCP
jgi:hypothetical protein